MNKQVFCDHPKVAQMWSMNFAGNIIPQTWYKTITKKDGKPDTTAIILLSEIVYWYRPQEIRDEISGEFIGLKKKFHDDNYLQKGYQELADTFGFGYQEVQRAIKRLEDIGVIQRIFQRVASEKGVLPNMLFIDLNVDRLAELTYQVPERETTEETPCPATNITPDTNVDEVKCADKPKDEQDQPLIGATPSFKERRSRNSKTSLTPVSEPLEGMDTDVHPSYQKRQDVWTRLSTPHLDTNVHPSYQERQDVWTQLSTRPIRRDRRGLSDVIGQLHRLHTESISTKSSSSESTSRFREDHKHVMRKKTISKTSQQRMVSQSSVTATDRRSRIEKTIHTNIQYWELLKNEDAHLTDEIVRVMVDVLCADQETIRVNGMEMPAGVVKSQLLKLTPRHIESVLEKMRLNTSRIVNMPSYLLSALYNEAITSHHVNQAMVNSCCYG